MIYYYYTYMHTKTYFSVRTSSCCQLMSWKNLCSLMSSQPPLRLPRRVCTSRDKRRFTCMRVGWCCINEVFHTHTHSYTYTYTHTHIHITPYLYTPIHTSIHTDTHTYTPELIHTHTYTYTEGNLPSPCTRQGSYAETPGDLEDDERNK